MSPAGHKLEILLPQIPKCWDDRYKVPYHTHDAPLRLSLDSRKVYNIYQEKKDKV